MTKEEKRVYDQNYNKTNREKLRKKNAKYYAENKEKCAEYVKNWRDKNRDRLKAAENTKKALDPKKWAAEALKWRKANPEKAKLIAINHSARKGGYAEIKASPEEVKAFLDSIPPFCQICKKPLVGRDDHLDHCHKTGELRGRLCARHNNLVGTFENHPDHFSKIQEYILSSGRFGRIGA